MPGLGLGFGGNRQQVLVALARDVVDRYLDLFFGGPLIDQVRRGLVGARNPVIPEAHRQFAGGMRAPNIGRSNQRRG